MGARLQGPVILGESEGDGDDPVHDPLVVSGRPVGVGVGEGPRRNDVVDDLLPADGVLSYHRLRSCEAVVGEVGYYAE